MKRKICTLRLVVALLLLAIFSVQGKTIRFVGDIVQESCAVYVNDQQIHSECLRQGKSTLYQQQAYPFNRLAMDHRQADFIRSSRMHWLDNANQVGLLEIEYR